MRNYVQETEFDLSDGRHVRIGVVCGMPYQLCPVYDVFVDGSLEAESVPIGRRCWDISELVEEIRLSLKGQAQSRQADAVLAE